MSENKMISMRVGVTWLKELDEWCKEIDSTRTAAIIILSRFAIRMLKKTSLTKKQIDKLLR